MKYYEMTTAWGDVYAQYGRVFIIGEHSGPICERVECLVGAEGEVNIRKLPKGALPRYLVGPHFLVEYTVACECSLDDHIDSANMTLGELLQQHKLRLLILTGQPLPGSSIG